MQIQSARILDRVFADKPPDFRVIVAVSVVMQPGLVIERRLKGSETFTFDRKMIQGTMGNDDDEESEMTLTLTFPLK
jgi:hypothetical protein